MRLRIGVGSSFPLARAAVAACVLWAAQALPTAAEKRVAFVVGIDRYDRLSEGLQLKKAANDATAVGDTMRDLGYEVIRAENVGRVELLRQWNRFLHAVEPGGTAMPTRGTSRGIR